MKSVPIDWLTADDVRAFHDAVLEPENLTGESAERPIEGALDAVINQVMYSESDLDTVQIACLYAVKIARGHCFNDGNKRTAFMCLKAFLDDHGLRLSMPNDSTLTPIMEGVASGDINEFELYNILIDSIAHKQQ